MLFRIADNFIINLIIHNSAIFQNTFYSKLKEKMIKDYSFIKINGSYYMYVQLEKIVTITAKYK